MDVRVVLRLVWGKAKNIINPFCTFYKSSLIGCSFFYSIESERLKLLVFDDSDIDKLEEVPSKRKNWTSSKLYKQAGNSIVIDVLMAIIKVLM